MNQNDIMAAIDYFKCRLKQEPLFYRERPSIHVAIQALEKQVAKKPKPCSSGDVCPCCGLLFWMYKNLPREQLAEWCSSCGQKLDWSDNSEY